jgi:membrane protein
MKLKLKDIWKMLKQTGSAFVDDNVLKMSAALSYYTMFALAPMLLVIITVASFFYKKEEITGSVNNQISGFVGPEGAQQLQEILNNAAISNDGTLATIIGIIMLIIAATGVFVEIQDSINTIWCLKAKPKRGFLKLLVNRLLSFSMVISLGFIMLVSLVINALMEALSNRLEAMFPNLTVYVIYGINLLITLAITTLLFAIIFKVLPDAKIRWKTVVIGAVTTAILFMLGKFGITFYIGSSDLGSTYGAAGSIVIILVWVYYSAMILYFGAVFTKVYAQYTGHDIHPSQYAVFVRYVETENKASLQAQESTKKIQEDKKED